MCHQGDIVPCPRASSRGTGRAAVKPPPRCSEVDTWSGRSHQAGELDRSGCRCSSGSHPVGEHDKSEDGWVERARPVGRNDQSADLNGRPGPEALAFTRSVGDRRPISRGRPDDVRREPGPRTEPRPYSPEVPASKSSAVVGVAVPIALVPASGLTWLKTFQPSPKRRSVKPTA